MTRIMRDSVTPGDIPLDGCDLFAGYTNGSQSQWPANAWERFPAGSTVRIDVLGTDLSADVLDVETGDASVSTAVAWVRSKLGVSKPGAFLPVLYANRSTLTPLYNALNAAGYYVNRHFKIWIGTLDGTKSVADMTGVVAVQYAGANLTGGHYDESIVYDDEFKPAPVPIPTPPPALRTGVVVELPSGQTASVSSADGGQTWKNTVVAH